MKKYKLILAALACAMLASCGSPAPEVLSFTTAKFKTGDDPAWSAQEFDDSEWEEMTVAGIYDKYGYKDYDGYSWYRLHFTLPANMKTPKGVDVLRISLGPVDDCDQTFLNGKLIGGIGVMDGEYSSEDTYMFERDYYVEMNDPALVWGGENVLAVRVYDGNGEGGIWGSGISVSRAANLDFFDVALDFEYPSLNSSVCRLSLKDNASSPISMDFSGRAVYDGQKTVKFVRNENLKLSPGESFSKEYDIEIDGHTRVIFDFVNNANGRRYSHSVVPKYVLTPEAPDTPEINGPRLMGARPGNPVLYKIPASGLKPMSYDVIGLPEGLAVDKEKGIVTGSVKRAGEYKVTFVAENSVGKAEKEFTFVIGDTIALTPPLGWNSWNCWGVSVSQDKVRSSAQALLDMGLQDYGWTYINIDDAWQGPQRAKDGGIVANDRFPDIKGLGEWLHSNGLKLGIYSSPGPYTCGKYEGSWQHEAQDAATYSDWGVDYLKYDWCGYSRIFAAEGDDSRAAYVKPYAFMGDILASQPRDIVYSLCQYGMDDVWEWGASVKGNCWRTTGDIGDSWESMAEIGFRQGEHWQYAGPGHWNDPDMLVLGKVGWGPSLHDTTLSPDEQYSHITLWCLLDSPLLMGCDISQLDAFNKGLVSNPEVLAVNQDALGQAAHIVWEKDEIQIWAKDLEDGGKAVGIFNLGPVDFLGVLPVAEAAGLDADVVVRDLWKRQEASLSKLFVPSHGCKLYKISEQ